MIEKFITIKNVGKFRTYGASGDIGFRKLSLVYAENGRGKTTLCAMLRSLQTGDPSFIMERRTLGSKSLPQIQVLVAGRKVSFDGNVWSEKHENLVVFDSAYVAENVYSGDFVEHDHKKRLYQVSVGKRGVELAQKVTELDGRNRDLAGKLQESTKSLEKMVPAGMALENYLALPPDPAIDAKIAEKTKAVEALANAEAIRGRSGFMKLTCPSLPPGIAELLRREIEGVAKDVEATIRHHIAFHRMGSPGQAWISQGLPFVQEDACPFCHQSVASNRLLQAYRVYFGDAYRSLKAEIATLESGFATAFSEAAFATLKTTLIQNAANVEFWKPYTTVSLPELSFETGIMPQLRAISSSIAPLIRQKIASPLDALAFSPEAEAATKGLDELRIALDAYNEAVATAQSSVAIVKKSVELGNATALRAELARLQAQKERHSTAVSALCAEHQAAQQQKARMETAKTKAKKELDEYTETILRESESGINQLLDRFGAGFRITGTKQQYLGGSPSSTFRLDIGGMPVELGDAKTPRGEPCFRSAMSSGDRSTLALVFFLVQLQQRSDIADLTVVFDDPLTSLDRFRQHCTRDQIRAVEKKAKQVIVLSHEPAFLQKVAEDCDSARLRLLVLARDGVSDSTIKEWDMKAELAPGFHKDVVTLTAYYHGDAEDVRGVIRCIRPVLEGYLRNAYHGSFAENEWFGGMIDRIRNSVPGQPLEIAKPILADLESLNDFTKRYHHDDNSPKQTTEPIQDAELQSLVKITLRLINRL